VRGRGDDLPASGGIGAKFDQNEIVDAAKAKAASVALAMARQRDCGALGGKNSRGGRAILLLSRLCRG
jgi:hypothetical protein